MGNTVSFSTSGPENAGEAVSRAFSLALPWHFRAISRSAVHEDRERCHAGPSRKGTHPNPKAVLRLPDLDRAKSAVLNSLTSADAQRGYPRD